MAEVTFIDLDGSVHRGEALEGQPLLRTALALNVKGILAECGGLCACATCHCYVEPPFDERLSPPTDMEQGMLATAAAPTDASRLVCQIVAGPELDGIVLRVAGR